MDKYLKAKIPVKSNDDRIDKELERRQKLKELDKIKPVMVDDLSKPLVKDLPVDRINTNLTTPVLDANDAMKKIAESRVAGKTFNAPENVIDYGAFKKKAPTNLPAKEYDAAEMKRQYAEKAKLEKTRGLRFPKGLKAIGPIGALSQVVPSLVDLKEGNPNTAIARLTAGLAPMGTDAIGDKLIEQGQLQDRSPEFLDPTYLNTLKAIGQRRAQAGKSPIVESFSGQPVDTSATEDSDILNRIKAKMRDNSQG